MSLYTVVFDCFSFKDILLFVVYAVCCRIKYPKEHKQAVEQYALANAFEVKLFEKI